MPRGVALRRVIWCGLAHNVEAEILWQASLAQRPGAGIFGVEGPTADLTTLLFGRCQRSSPGSLGRGGRAWRLPVAAVMLGGSTRWAGSGRSHHQGC